MYVITAAWTQTWMQERERGLPQIVSRKCHLERLDMSASSARVSLVQRTLSCVCALTVWSTSLVLLLLLLSSSTAWTFVPSASKGCERRRISWQSACCPAVCGGARKSPTTMASCIVQARCNMHRQPGHEHQSFKLEARARARARARASTATTASRSASSVWLAVSRSTSSTTMTTNVAALLRERQPPRTKIQSSKPTILLCFSRRCWTHKKVRISSSIRWFDFSMETHTIRKSLGLLVCFFGFFGFFGLFEAFASCVRVLHTNARDSRLFERLVCEALSYRVASSRIAVQCSPCSVLLLACVC